MRPVLPTLALAMLVAFTGCKGSETVAAPTSEARAVTLAIAGTANMNAGGNAAVVTVYQLTDADPFGLIPLEEFWSSTDAALAGTLVSKREVVLYPQEVRAVPFVLDARTTHVGIAADFRSPSLDGWRLVVPAGRVLADGLGVLVKDNGLALTGPPAPETVPGAPAPAAPGAAPAEPAPGPPARPTRP